MSSQSVEAQFAEAKAWCQDRADELSAAILDSPGPFSKLPFKVYGAVCRQSLAYAVSLGAAHLIPDLGASTIEDEASMSEALKQVRLLAGWLTSQTAGTAAGGDGQRPARTEGTSAPPPKPLLTGWREITAALDMRYSDRSKVKSLNDRFQGPIVHHGAGTRPMVRREQLLVWWDRLEVHAQELANEREGARLSAEEQYNFGRAGKAAPKIGGGVKKRRQDRRS